MGWAFPHLVWDAPPGNLVPDALSLETVLGPDAPRPLTVALPILVQSADDEPWSITVAFEAAALAGTVTVREWPESPSLEAAAGPMWPGFPELFVVAVPRRGDSLASWAKAVGRAGETLRREDPNRPFAVTLGADGEVLGELAAVLPLNPDVVRLSPAAASGTPDLLEALRQVHRRRRALDRRFSLVVDSNTLDPEGLGRLIALGADAVLVAAPRLCHPERSRVSGALALDVLAEEAAQALGGAEEAFRQLLRHLGAGAPCALRLGHLAAARLDVAASLALRPAGWYPTEYSVARQADTLTASYRHLEAVLAQTAALLQV
jgi:hypothetical protein